jgi:ABC-type lipoprotein release transport system permease subunit
MLAKNFGGLMVDLFYFPVWFVFFVIIFSTVVGLATGFYPAKRAAKLNALEALRYK